MGKLSDYFADNVFGIIHNSHTDQDQQKAQETLQTKISLKCKTSDIFVHMFYILYKILLYSPLFDSSMKKVIPYSSVSLKNSIHFFPIDRISPHYTPIFKVCYM